MTPGNKEGKYNKKPRSHQVIRSLNPDNFMTLSSVMCHTALHLGTSSFDLLLKPLHKSSSHSNIDNAANTISRHNFAHARKTAGNVVSSDTRHAIHPW